MVDSARSEKARRAAELARGRPDRPAARRQHRIVRTVVLGAFAVAAIIVWLAREFGIEWRELARLAGMSAVFVAVPVALALLVAAVARWVRAARRRP